MASGILVCIAPVSIIFLVLSTSNFPYVLQENLESGKKNLLLRSEILVFGIRNTTQRISGIPRTIGNRNPSCTYIETESTAGSPELQDFLGFLTWDDKIHTVFLCLVHAAGLLPSSSYLRGFSWEPVNGSNDFHVNWGGGFKIILPLTDNLGGNQSEFRITFTVER